jgi:hypothetical protein
MAVGFREFFEKQEHDDAGRVSTKLQKVLILNVAIFFLFLLIDWILFFVYVASYGSVYLGVFFGYYIPEILIFCSVTFLGFFGAWKRQPLLILIFIIIVLVGLCLEAIFLILFIVGIIHLIAIGVATVYILYEVCFMLLAVAVFILWAYSLHLSIILRRLLTSGDHHHHSGGYQAAPSNGPPPQHTV